MDRLSGGGSSQYDTLVFHVLFGSTRNSVLRMHA